MKRKGFGQSQPPMRDAKKFMQAFAERLTEAQGDQTQIHQFFESNRAKLDKPLLEALPFVFKALAEEFPEAQKNTAQLFWAFGNLIQQFPLGDRLLNLELSITAYQHQVVVGYWQSSGKTIFLNSFLHVTTVPTTIPIGVMSL